MTRRELISIFIENENESSAVGIDARGNNTDSPFATRHARRDVIRPCDFRDDIIIIITSSAGKRPIEIPVFKIGISKNAFRPIVVTDFKHFPLG